MGAKKGKKKGKGGKKKKDNKPQELRVPNFIPSNPPHIPIAVKVCHLDEIFLIYSEEYHLAKDFFDEIVKIKGYELDDFHLYFKNKRLVEIDTVNHDQCIVNNSTIYLCLKSEKINEILEYNIYEPSEADLAPPKIEEEGKVEEVKEEKKDK